MVVTPGGEDVLRSLGLDSDVSEDDTINSSSLDLEALFPTSRSRTPGNLSPNHDSLGSPSENFLCVPKPSCKQDGVEERVDGLDSDGSPSSLDSEHSEELSRCLNPESVAVDSTMPANNEAESVSHPAMASNAPWSTDENGFAAITRSQNQTDSSQVHEVIATFTSLQPIHHNESVCPFVTETDPKYQREEESDYSSAVCMETTELIGKDSIKPASVSLNLSVEDTEREQTIADLASQAEDPFTKRDGTPPPGTVAKAVRNLEVALARSRSVSPAHALVCQPLSRPLPFKKFIPSASSMPPACCTEKTNELTLCNEEHCHSAEDAQHSNNINESPSEVDVHISREVQEVHELEVHSTTDEMEKECHKLMSEGTLESEQFSRQVTDGIQCSQSTRNHADELVDKLWAMSAVAENLADEEQRLEVMCDALRSLTRVKSGVAVFEEMMNQLRRHANLNHEASSRFLELHSRNCSSLPSTSALQAANPRKPLGSTAEAYMFIRRTRALPEYVQQSLADVQNMSQKQRQQALLKLIEDLKVEVSSLRKSHHRQFALAELQLRAEIRQLRSEVSASLRHRTKLQERLATAEAVEMHASTQRRQQAAKVVLQMRGVHQFRMSFHPRA